MDLFCSLFISLFFLPLIAMNNHNNQLELCATRNTAYARPVREAEKQKTEEPQKAVTKPCPFCDADILKTNHIFSEDSAKNIRIIFNKFPYPSLDQGIHLLCTLITHKAHPNDLSSAEFVEQIDAAHSMSRKLHNEAYTQEYFTNWGAIAGQSVPHWHSHIVSFNEPPCSLTEKMQRQKNQRIQSIEEAFIRVKKKLASEKYITMPLITADDEKQCVCCTISKEIPKNMENLVIERFKYNYLCLSQYPRWAGELSVVPYRHLPAIAHLSPEELRENMIIAKAVLPIMTEYANTYIRDCTGGNIYTKSICSKASHDQHNYHVHTTVIPRTTIAPTPGTVEGNSCKLDFNPEHLMTYLSDQMVTIKTKISQ